MRRDAGLQYRPLANPVKALLAWWPDEFKKRVSITAQQIEQMKAKGKEPPPQKGPVPDQLRAGPTMEREAELREVARVYRTVIVRVCF